MILKSKFSCEMICQVFNFRQFFKGMKAGIPVCAGYFSVSFGFGSMAVAQGLNILHSVLISATNLTSAGQFAGLTVIVSGATIIELILTQLIINSRYALMSLALSQKLGQKVGFFKRLVCAYFNTDELFAIGMSEKDGLNPTFFVGAGTIAWIGWVGGTALGAVAGSALPPTIRASLSVMLYGMFIAIVTPQAKQEKAMLVNMLLALIFSCAFNWIPGLNQVSDGLVIVICTVAAAAICAILFPVKQEVAE